MKFKILPYKAGSQGAKLLAEHLSKLVGYKVFRVSHLVDGKIINWGCHGQRLDNCVNRSIPVNHARNKLAAFALWTKAQVPTVEWTNSKEQAALWQREGDIVYERHTITGQEGAGIKVRQPEDALLEAPLYTKYFSAKGEYRVHVMKGEVIDYARKKKKQGAEGNKFVRSHDNGYVFSRVDVLLPEVVSNTAKRAVEALGLEFGAVDVLHNEKQDIPAVLEVNTAPGLENRTAEAYAQAFVKHF